MSKANFSIPMLPAPIAPSGRDCVTQSAHSASLSRYSGGGQGWGPSTHPDPHPNPPPEYREREQVTRQSLSARRRGFTLVEVLATLMLMTIALPVILQTISIATSAASLSKRRVEASLLCQSKVDELIATGQWQNGQLSGDFQPDWPDYTWTAQVEDFDGVSQELDVTINWLGRGNIQDSLTLSTIVYPNNPITMANGAGGASGTSGTSNSANGGLP